MDFLFDATKCQNAFDKLTASGTDYYNLLILGCAGDVDEAIAKQVKIGCLLMFILEQISLQY